MNQKRTVVITGLGVVSPIGNNVEELWASVREGKNGIAPITRYDVSGRKVTLAAELKGFDPETEIDKREVRKMDRYSQYAVTAAVQAFRDAGIEEPAAADGASAEAAGTDDKGSSAVCGGPSGGKCPCPGSTDEQSVTGPACDRSRWGVVMASGIGGIRTIEEEQMKGEEKGYDRVSPFFIPKAISNMAAGHIAIRYGLKGSCTCVVTACASGGNAIGDAFRQIRDGYADLMLAGGSEAAITPLSMGGFTSLKALTTAADPDRASIPFDKERSGFVMGEGAAALVLESEEHAKKRGAHIYARITGYGANCDAYHITAPDPSGEGAAACMRLALQDAGIAPEDVDYINAHGTSTPLNDSGETKAIRMAFGSWADHLKVSSTKSMTGHLLGASAALEAVITVKALEQGFLPPTINYREPDPACDLDIVPNQGYDYDIRCAISNSLGFGGHNVTLVFQK